MDKVTVLINRLNKIGITINLSGNFPWIYIDSINGVKVTENFKAEHGFTLAMTPIRMGQETQFTDISEIFKLIRKYVN